MRYPSLSGALGGLQGGRRFEFATSNRRQRPGWRGQRGMDGAVFRGVRRDSAPGPRTALLTRPMGRFALCRYHVGIASVSRRCADRCRGGVNGARASARSAPGALRQAKTRRARSGRPRVGRVCPRRWHAPGLPGDAQIPAGDGTGRACRARRTLERSGPPEERRDVLATSTYSAGYRARSGLRNALVSHQLRTPAAYERSEAERRARDLAERDGRRPMPGHRPPHYQPAAMALMSAALGVLPPIPH